MHLLNINYYGYLISILSLGFFTSSIYSQDTNHHTKNLNNIKSNIDFYSQDTSIQTNNSPTKNNTSTNSDKNEGIKINDALPMHSDQANNGNSNPLSENSDKKTEKYFNPHWFNSKMGEGFTIKSDDGESMINIRVRAQIQAVQVIIPEDRSQDETNFTTRRMRLMARGKLKGDDWHYYVQFGFSNMDMEIDRPIPLRDSVLTYNGWKRLKFSFGQMKVPFNRQRLISSSALQLVDRSIVNAELNLDRDVGIQAFSHDFFGLSKYIGFNLGVFGGDGRNRTASGSGLLTVAKITYFPFGNFLSHKLAGVDDELLSEGDFKRHKTPTMAIAIGSGYNSNTNRSQSTIGNVYEFSRFNYTHGLAELFVKWQGWTFITEWISREANLPYQEIDLPNGELRREYSRSAHGYFFQLAYLFENNWEIATRWGEILPKERTDPRLVYSREAGGGLSYYFAKHNLKWQIDYFRLTGNPNLLGDSHEIRTQIQFFY